MLPPDRAVRDASIDGLRAVAAISVLAYHAWLYSQARPSAAYRGSFGDAIVHEFRLGLVLFFVLSGYLLFQPWLRAARDGGPRPLLGAYLLRRGARILPAYYLALAGSIALLWGHDAVPGVRLVDDSQLWLFAAFAQNLHEATLLKLDPPMWTLTVEMSFYLVLPLLGWVALRLRGAGRARQALVPLAFLALGVAYNWYFAHQGQVADPISKVLPAMAPYFAIGMLAAVIAHGRSFGRAGVGALLAVGLAAVVGDAAWAAHHAEHGSHALALRIWRDDLAAAGFAAIVVAAAHARAPLALLGARPVAWTGRVSYGIYLWHVPLMLWLRINGLLPSSPVAALAVVLGPTLVVAATSWRWLERPLQQRAARATRRLPEPRGSALPAPARA